MPVLLLFCSPSHELKLLMESAAALAERRKRLASLSWFMRALCEPIARRANREDKCGGRFWEGRFKCQALLDEAAVLACSLYVDLNPIWAGVAATPEASTHTSAFDRIAARQARLQLEHKRRAKGMGRAPSGKSRQAAALAESQDGWLCPIPEGGKTVSPAKEIAAGTLRRRASDRGFLPLELDVYLRLLDWTGRQVRRDKRGAIPADLQPILERLCVNGETLIETVRQFGRWFHRAVGRASSMTLRASEVGRHWFQGVRHSQAAFT